MASKSGVIGSTLSALVALAFVTLGAGSFVAPRALAGNYGLPVSDDTGVAYVRALGVRDLVLGLLTGAFLLARVPRGVLGVTVAFCALVGAGDFTLVATTPTANRKCLPIHGFGTVGLVVIWALLRRGR